MIKEKFALIGGDIHKLIRIKKYDQWDKYSWRVHYKGNLYFVPVKDECKHDFEPKTTGYIRRRVFNNKM